MGDTGFEGTGIEGQGIEGQGIEGQGIEGQGMGEHGIDGWEIEEIVGRLGLCPHPEGGFFAETWRSDESTGPEGLPARYEGARPLGTSIYYLLTREGFSALHRLRSDEVWHLYAGAPVALLLLRTDGSAETVRLGRDLAAGARPQVHVPRGTWQGAYVADEGPWSLVGCTVVPGFAFEDFELGAPDALVRAWPTHEAAIRRLCRPSKGDGARGEGPTLA